MTSEVPMRRLMKGVEMLIARSFPNRPYVATLVDRLVTFVPS
jgi:hypothetical protein